MKNKILTGALAALTIGGALAATTVPASAQPGWRGGYHGGGYGYRHDGWGSGGAVAAGILAGAAIAGGLGGGYGGYYAPAPAYYDYGPRCRVEMRWNARWGGYDRVRVCY